MLLNFQNSKSLNVKALFPMSTVLYRERYIHSSVLLSPSMNVLKQVDFQSRCDTKMWGNDGVGTLLKPALSSLNDCFLQNTCKRPDVGHKHAIT